MNAVGYTRVSTAKQVDGVSLEAQAARIRAWSRGAGREIRAIYTDAGISGARDDRPGLAAALEALEPGDALVVYSLSRLGRSTSHLIALADDLRRRGVDLVSITEGLDCTTAAGRLMYTLIAALAAFEREQTSERTKAALQHLKQQGRAYGTTPYAYRRRGDRLELDPDRAAVLERMQQARADGMSYSALAAALNSAGIPSARGGRWYAASVRSVLMTAADAA
jgi:DNA invertase Pin-like site-specific DNA recombinase